MSIRLIRQDSQTPNVTNHDDARMVRYAYGGFDGFVKDRGSEIDYAIDGTSFVVQSGVLVLQGWEVEIDANGAAISVPPNVSTTQYFSVYLEVNCGTDTAAIKSTYRSGTYPDIPASDDLTANTVGTARLLLYRFTATNGVISNVKKAVQGIEYSLYNINELRDGLQNGTIIPANAKSVNALEIKRDENGVLRIGDTIIPQRKLLWRGDLTIETGDSNKSISLSDNLINGDNIEIVTEEGIYKFIAAINISSFKPFYCQRIIGVGTSQINVSTLTFTTNGTSPKSLTVNAPREVVMYSGSGNNYYASISSDLILGSFYYHANNASWTIRKIYKVIE